MVAHWSPIFRAFFTHFVLFSAFGLFQQSKTAECVVVSDYCFFLKLTFMSWYIELCLTFTHVLWLLSMREGCQPRLTLMLPCCTLRIISQWWLHATIQPVYHHLLGRSCVYRNLCWWYQFSLILVSFTYGEIFTTAVIYLYSFLLFLSFFVMIYKYLVIKNSKFNWCFAELTYYFFYFQAKEDTEQQEVWGWSDPVHSCCKHCHSQFNKSRW